MAWNRLMLTAVGKTLYAKAQQGKPLVFTRVGIGDGQLGSGSLVNRTALISEKKSLLIDAIQIVNEVESAVITSLSNADLVTGFYFREIGVFARDPDTQAELLYLYDNAGTDGEYIPDKQSGVSVSERLKFLLLLENVTSVSFVGSGNPVYLTAEDIDDTITGTGTLWSSSKTAAAAAAAEAAAKAASRPATWMPSAGDVGAIPAAQKGVAGGVAELDSSGKVISTQLPSYVDDVLEFENKTLFPVTGESGKIYVDVSTNLTWRWSGSTYTEISPSLALGETSSTAYRGDRGKAAYDHIQDAEKHVTAEERAKWNKSTVISGVCTIDSSARTINMVHAGYIAQIGSIVRILLPEKVYLPIGYTLNVSGAGAFLIVTSDGGGIDFLDSGVPYDFALSYADDNITKVYRLVSSNEQQCILKPFTVSPQTATAVDNYDLVSLSPENKAVAQYEKRYLGKRISFASPGEYFLAFSQLSATTGIEIWWNISTQPARFIVKQVSHANGVRSVIKEFSHSGRSFSANISQPELIRLSKNSLVFTVRTNDWYAGFILIQVDNAMNLQYVSQYFDAAVADSGRNNGRFFVDKATAVPQRVYRWSSFQNKFWYLDFTSATSITQTEIGSSPCSDYSYVCMFNGKLAIFADSSTQVGGTFADMSAAGIITNVSASKQIAYNNALYGSISDMKESDGYQVTNTAALGDNGVIGTSSNGYLYMLILDFATQTPYLYWGDKIVEASGKLTDAVSIGNKAYVCRDKVIAIEKNSVSSVAPTVSVVDTAPPQAKLSAVPVNGISNYEGRVSTSYTMIDPVEFFHTVVCCAQSGMFTTKQIKRFLNGNYLAIKIPGTETFALAVSGTIRIPENDEILVGMSPYYLLEKIAAGLVCFAAKEPCCSSHVETVMRDEKGYVVTIVTSFAPVAIVGVHGSGYKLLATREGFVMSYGQSQQSCVPRYWNDIGMSGYLSNGWTGIPPTCTVAEEER